MVSKKIAIYSGEIPSTTFIERLIEGIAASGHTVCLFGHLKERRRYTKNVIVFGYTNRIEKFWQLLYYSTLLLLFKNQDKKKLDDLLAQQGNDSIANKTKFYPVLYSHPDLFHLQWAKGISDWIWVQEFGIKLVLSLRGTHVTISPIGNEKWADLYSQTFPKIDGFHSVSNAIGIAAQHYGANQIKIKTVYSGLDLEKLSFSLKEKMNNPLKVISIGRSHWVKGYNYALDAFSMLKKEAFAFDYTIIGVGSDEELLMQRSQLGLEYDVHFIPSLPFHEVVSKIKEADVVLLSSVEEGIANVVLEAMALGTLVVSTDCGGMNEVIVDGENGFLIPIRNPEIMAETIQKVTALSIPEYQKRSLSALKTIKDQHSYPKMISDMKHLYETVLSEPS
ncbi:glycosyltransferase family 4 protein [Flavobacterium sp.]|uniref:glycosyltransferase family 4 protein n=1 Tax=Flavobacterium sp. TaxID=239 RepID=UPI00261FC6A1|nr:glycosyltransferase family 4 protein [Flavobacterium sp.]